MYWCECWTVKKAELWRIDAFELWCWRRLLSPLNSKEIQLINPKGNQSWIFIGRTDAEAEALIFWPPGAKNQLIGKDPAAGKDWRQEEKGMTEDEMDGITDLMDMNLGKLWEIVRDRKAWHTTVHGVAKSQTCLSDWTTTMYWPLVTVLTNDTRMPGFQSYCPWILGSGCSQQHTQVCLSWINSTFLLKPGKQDSLFAL